MNKPVLRTLFFIFALIALLTLPWWISIVLILGLTIYFPLYLEILFFGFLFDTLYGAKYSFPYPALTVALVFLLLVSLGRKYVRM